MKQTPRHIIQTLWCGILACCWAMPILAQDSLPEWNPDSTEAVEAWVATERNRLSQLAGPLTLGQAQRMMELGLWDRAEQWLIQLAATDPEAATTLAELHLLQYRFTQAEQWLGHAAQDGVDSRKLALLQAQLYTQSWELEKARTQYVMLLKQEPQDVEALIGLGHIYLLQKNFLKALALAEQALTWDSTAADAYILAAEANLWLLHLPEAEERVYRCLQLNPLHADARFLYGYLIWRHVRVPELPQMAAQWEIALMLNPLHFRTHWHWGNGHTHLTYMDYAHPSDAQVTADLKVVDTLLSQRQWDLAMDTLHAIQRTYPVSLLPQMRIGSMWYNAYYTQGEPALDSAAATFRRILLQKPHYGPAHNGLAAVLKQRQLMYLVDYDSLEQQIALGDMPSQEFLAVFPDVNRYPGNRVSHMVWQQLHTAQAYLPMLARMERVFAIPPLHEDLATAMKNPFFRRSTTFDNRQWMDIRGVGSGATGIEYVERGAHLERNVTLHEFTHLFHQFLLTETEKRQVRAYYFQAMKDSTYLDYYAANNDFEYFAQAFPAYFSFTKVHPLNHKAANTHEDLKGKDPAFFTWIDALVQRQRQSMSGDASAMAANWAEAYLFMAKEAPAIHQLALLDTAYMWDSTYLPVYMGYVRFWANQEEWDLAEDWLAKARNRRSDYIGADVAEARMLERQYEHLPSQRAVLAPRIVAAYGRALSKESDHWEIAKLNKALREAQWRMGLALEALETTETYLLQAPRIATSLNDYYVEAETFWYTCRASLGYVDEAQSYFRAQLTEFPNNVTYWLGMAELYRLAGDFEALEKHVQAAKIAIRQPDVTLDQYLLLAYIGQGKSDPAIPSMERFLHQQHVPYRGNLRLWAEIMIERGDTSVLEPVLDRLATQIYPLQQANYLYAKGKALLFQGDLLAAMDVFSEGIYLNAYHFPTRIMLIDLYLNQGYSEEAERLKQEGLLLPFPPGPLYEAQLQAFQSGR